MPPLHERLMELAVSRGFLLPSAEIYNAPGGFYDYGPAGAALKRHIEEQWRRIFITEPGFLEIESCNVLPQAVLVASGHVEHFADPVTECSKCHQRYRADHLLEQKTLSSWAGLSPSDLNAGIKEHKLACPACKSELGPVGWVNLMFPTYIGAGIENQAFLRPETAQGMFLDFKRLFVQQGSKLPLAVGQIGRSYRNEVSPRQGLIRSREFSQMELEYFFAPAQDKLEGFEKIANEKVRVLPPADGDAPLAVEDISLREAISRGYFPNEILAYMVYLEDRLYASLGISRAKYRFRVMPRDELPHYSKGNVDLEAETSYGFIETSGIAYRTDFDLSQHAKHSKQDLSVFVDEEKKRLIPHVVEPSMGVDRTLWCVLESAYRPAGNGKEWEWFAFPPRIAPFVAGVFPLMKKDGLDELAQRLTAALRAAGLEVYYSQSGSIGKRYARADEIGVPYCITIDYETKEKAHEPGGPTVTIRFRDDGQQERVKISEAAAKLLKLADEGRVRKE
ncbi:MAG: glycine--tRNA ligase [Candidatus Marsarchaeota archaeon]|nr:glycine--tRNA ligase [Candidatus Marsarchaeota archaeon]